MPACAGMTVLLKSSQYWLIQFVTPAKAGVQQFGYAINKR
jgi:hypothetical protein